MANFDEAVGVLLMTQPFFGTLLMKVEHVPDSTLDPPTLCVTNRQLRYHPDLVEKCSLDELVFGLCHEVLHLAWGHLPRMLYYKEKGYGPDGKPMNWKLFNMAADYPINDALVQAKIGSPIAFIKICLDKRFPETMTPEEVYCLLAKEGEGGGSGQQPLDGHDFEGESSGEGQDSTPAITASDVMQAANTHKIIRGNWPAGMERLIEHMRKPAVSPWRALRSFITTSMPGHDATTWRRLQRQYIVRGIGMPGQTQQGAGRVGVVIDTSGSIDSEMLAKFAGHMASIMDDAKPKDMVIYWTDSKVHSAESVKNSSQLRAFLAKGAKGGGGTFMPAGVRAAEADKCDAVVVLTDGMTPFTDSNRPLIWAITDQSVTAAGNGKTIHI